jgi:hypothetical protein
MSALVVCEVIAVEDLPPGLPASRRLIARFSDGSVGEALRWYAEDCMVSEGDVIGKTRAEIASLAHTRDARYLSEPEDPGRMPFFED